MCLVKGGSVADERGRKVYSRTSLVPYLSSYGCEACLDEKNCG